MSYLEIIKVAKNFGGVEALRDVSLDLEQGVMLGIMGANGAGKTTLFSVIAGHTKANTGEVRLGGQSLHGYRPDRVCRSGIARTFQIVRPFRSISVIENVSTAARFGSAPAGSSAAASDRARKVLATLDLLDHADKLAGELTLAAQKKLEVARALATQPKILLLDEVMAGLTPLEVQSMLSTIRRIKDQYGLTVLIIEHVMRALMDLSDRIVVLHHGEKIAEGPPAAIAVDKDVQRAYLGNGP